MTTDPFGVRDPRCTCTGTLGLLHSVLQDEEHPLCPVHHADEIKAREVEAKRGEELMRAARLRLIYDELRAPPAAPEPSCSCDMMLDLNARLSGRELPACPVHRPAQDVDPAVALNDDEVAAAAPLDPGAPGPVTSAPLGSDALLASLARLVGADPVNTDGDLPPAA